MSDIELLEQHRAGSRSAFAELVQKHIGWVYGMARRRLRDPHLSDDVTQAVFILLHNKAPRFPADGALIRWLHKTTWYATRVAERNQRRRIKHETEASMLRPDTTESLDSIQLQQFAPILDEWVDRLSRSDREAVLLRFYRDLSYVQIGAQIGASEEAARKRVERAIEKLKTFARQKHLAALSIALPTYLADHIRIQPPTDLLVRTISAPALTPSIASIVKGATMLMTIKTSAIAASSILFVLALGTSILAVLPPQQNNLRAPTTSPTVSIPSAGQFALAPAFRWHDDIPEVLLKGTWYELLAVDDLPLPKVVAFAKTWTTPDDWQRRIQEDWNELLRVMNVVPGPGNLQLRRLDTHELITMSAPPSSENRILLINGAANNLLPEALFSAVRWQGASAQVQINDFNTWYDWTGVNDRSAPDIIAFARKTYSNQWQQKIEKNSLDVLKAMDIHIVAGRAILHLQTLDTHESVTILKFLIPTPQLKGAPIQMRQRYAMLSPFSAVRWQGEKYQVQVNGVWYQLASIDGQTLDEIIDFTRTNYKPAELKKRIDEDLVEVLTKMGYPPGDSVTLELRDLTSGKPLTLDDIPMTAENRNAIMQSNRPPGRPRN